MKFIKDVAVRLGVVDKLTCKDDQLDFSDSSGSYNVPVIVGDIDPKLWKYIHLFIMEKASEGVKDLLPTTKAFISWLKYLGDTPPFISPKLKKNHPTYGYRMHLLDRIKAKSADNIKSTTASSYINTIKSFYEFLVSHNVVGSGKFYKYEMRMADDRVKVLSTDLYIKIIKKSGPSLNPMSKSTQKRFRVLIENCVVEYKLITKLMWHCGLRLQEACTLTAGLFNEDLLYRDDSLLVADIKIGPIISGVETKFGKDRDMFITNALYEEILEYIESDRYQRRLRKWKSKNMSKDIYDPVFITSVGNRFKCETYYSFWYGFVKSIKVNVDKKFNHKPHDLRATFATNFLGTALKYFPKDIDECLESVKGWMGHKHINTTLKYIRFLSRKKIANKVAEKMDTFVASAMGFEYE